MEIEKEQEKGKKIQKQEMEKKNRKRIEKDKGRERKERSVKICLSLLRSPLTFAKSKSSVRASSTACLVRPSSKQANTLSLFLPNLRHCRNTKSKSTPVNTGSPSACLSHCVCSNVFSLWSSLLAYLANIHTSVWYTEGSTEVLHIIAVASTAISQRLTLTSKYRMAKFTWLPSQS